MAWVLKYDNSSSRKSMQEKKELAETRASQLRRVGHKTQVSKALKGYKVYWWR